MGNVSRTHRNDFIIGIAAKKGCDVKVVLYGSRFKMDEGGKNLDPSLLLSYEGYCSTLVDSLVVDCPCF